MSKGVNMGELSKYDAENKRNEFVEILSDIKKSVRENFEEMDFVNAIERNVMETYIESMEQEYENIISELNEICFE